jgi:hypothetical protein
MENQNPGSRGEFGSNSTGREEEQRFGEEAHAYTLGRDELIRDRELGRGEAWLSEESRCLIGDDTLLGSENMLDRRVEQGGTATSSAMVGTDTTAVADSAYDSPTKGTQQCGGIGSADHGTVGTVNSGSGAGLSSGSSAGGLIGAGVSDEAAWQRDRSGFQEHFAARHPSQDEATIPRTWDQAEPTYRYGYEAARDERYRGRDFDEIEPDLRHNYAQQAGAISSDQESGWERLREEVREAFDHFRAS